jgi:hypothetical protein
LPAVKLATEDTENTEKKELHRFQASLILYDRKEFGGFGVKLEKSSKDFLVSGFPGLMVKEAGKRMRKMEDGGWRRVAE